MNDFSRLIKNTRERSGRSFRDVAGDDWSPASLLKYEKGSTLPPRNRLLNLAQRYGVTQQDAKLAYAAAEAQIRKNGISGEHFDYFVESLMPGDRVVVISQYSLVLEQPHYSDIIAKIVSKNIHFTWVAAYLFSPANDVPKQWKSNHREVAVYLERSLRDEGVSTTSKHLHYLNIGRPNVDDFAFLCSENSGETVYICRRESANFQASMLWSQINAVDGERYWLARNDAAQRNVREWLTYSLGKDLPGLKMPPTAPHAKERQLCRFTLDKLLA